MTVHSLQTIRALALHLQGLTAPNASDSKPDLERLYRLVRQIGCVQIDTLQMVHRSQYLVLWSRLGNFNTADFHRLAYHPEDRRLFEGWQHAASFIPLEEYRFQMPRQRRLREQPSRWYLDWLEKDGHAELLERVLERVKQEGALKVSDFQKGDHRGGAWWDWRPAKVALEYQYAWGSLMIADRVNFQRVYDLTGHVLPEWVDTREPTPDERDRHWIELGARKLGACTPAQAADYTWMKLGRARPIVAELVREGVLVEIQARLMDGQTHPRLVHRENLPLLEQAADGAIHPQRTTFLSPFDSLFWARDRDEEVWGFKQVLEAYKPAPQRVWGYFCLPILHRDRLVGRFDPKLERKEARLRLKALYLEPGVEPDEELLSAVSTALRDFMQFHAARDLVIEKSEPEAFAAGLQV